MLQDHRHAYDDSYRYGFQGQERDDELKGPGNSLNYEYRMHDPRVGRFFAVDPLAAKYPHNSLYAFSENRVIDGVELEGLEYVSVYNHNNKTNSNKHMYTYKDENLKQDINMTFFWNAHSGIESVQVRAKGGPMFTYNKKPASEELTFHYGTENAKRPEWQRQLEVHMEAEKDMAANKGTYTHWYDSGASEDSDWKGKKGFQEKGVPLLFATVGTILTGGLGLEAFGTGYATTYLGSSVIGGTVNATGNMIGQLSSGSDFDYADPFIAFGSSFVPGGFGSIITGTFFSAGVDFTYKDGLQTPISSGLQQKPFKSTLSDFGFGLLGGLMGTRLSSSSVGMQTFGEAAVEHLNNKTNDQLDKK